MIARETVELAQWYTVDTQVNILGICMYLIGHCSVLPDDAALHCGISPQTCWAWMAVQERAGMPLCYHQFHQREGGPPLLRGITGRGTHSGLATPPAWADGGAGQCSYLQEITNPRVLSLDCWQCNIQMICDKRYDSRMVCLWLLQ